MTTHTTVDRRPNRGRIAAGAVGLALLAGACGGGDDALPADAFLGAEPANFCAAVTNGIGASQTEAGPDSDSLNTSIRLFRYADANLPSGAPDGMGRFITTTIDVAEMVRESLDRGESLDSSMSEEAEAALSELATIDFESLGAWLQDECGGVDGVDEAVLAGLTTAGPSGGFDFDDDDDGSATGGLDAAADDDAIAMDGDATESGGSAVGADAAPPETTIPKQRIVVFEGGSAATYLDTAVEVERIEALNHAPESFMADVPATGDEFYVVISVYAETDEASNRFAASDFVLVDDTGRPTSGAILMMPSGEPTSSVQLDTRDSASFEVAFERDVLVADLTGWRLSIDRDGDVPEFLPIGVPVDQPYPIALDASAAGSVIVESAVGACDAAVVDVAIVEASIGVEADDGRRLHRADAGQRYVSITVDALNTAEATGSQCDLTTPVFSYEFRLLVDGRPIASTHATENFEYLAPGASQLTNLTFEVPVEATELELVGAADESIATWSITLPTIGGE